MKRVNTKHRLANKAAPASLLALFALSGPAPLQAQTPPAAKTAPKAVLSQTIRGVTVTLSGIGWTPDEPPPGSNFSFYRSLQIAYSVQADPPLRLPPGKSLLNYVTKVTLIAPDGSALTGGGSGASSDASGARTSASVGSRDVDPRWPILGVDIDLQDPAAPARASGRSEGPITISDIPVPTAPDTVTHVHAETVTPLGTHVVVEKVQVSPEAKDTKTTFVLRVTPDPDAPDLRFSITSRDVVVVDDTGATLGLIHRGMMGGGDELEHERQPRLYWAGVSGTPTPGAKTLRLTLDTTESSEQLRDDSYYRHFHLRVPLKALYTGSARAYPPLMTKQGKDLVGQIDSLGWQWDRYRLRLILRDRTDPSVRWQLQSVQATDDAGNALTGHTPKGDNFLWKADGSPLAPGEAALETYLGGAAPPSVSYGVTPPVPAKTLTLTVQAQALHPQEHLLDFTLLPIPADGQTLTLNKTVSDAFGGKLTLEKITAYSPAHPLPPGVAARIAPLTLAPTGLALLLAEPPSKTTTRFDYQMIAVNDTTGRHLRPISTAFHGEGNALSDAPPVSGAPRLLTLFVRLPAPGAKTFNLRMENTEQIDLHKSETLVFPDIPAPPKPPAL